MAPTIIVSPLSNHLWVSAYIIISTSIIQLRKKLVWLVPKKIAMISLSNVYNLDTKTTIYYNIVQQYILSCISFFESLNSLVQIGKTLSCKQTADLISYPLYFLLRCSWSPFAGPYLLLPIKLSYKSCPKTWDVFFFQIRLSNGINVAWHHKY